MPRHWPQLDGLRGIAVLLVFCFHAHYYVASVPALSLASKGWIGVDLFFVLSGFLITGILVDARGAENFFSAFYARRSLRIWPLYFLLVALVFGLLPVVSPRVAETVRLAGPVWFYLLFVQNIFPHPRPSPVAVTWSLAVEEQFYICWSLLVRLLDDQKLLRLMWAIAALAPIARMAALCMGVSPSYLYFNLFHIDGLALGSVCAILMRHRKSSKALGSSFLGVGFLGCLLVGIPTQSQDITNPLTYTTVAVFFAGILLLCLYDERVAAVMSSRTLIFFGKISYCFYLVHVPVLSAMNSLLPTNPPSTTARNVLSIFVAFLVSVVLATLSLHLLENRFLTLKRHFIYRRSKVQSHDRAFAVMSTSLDN